MSNSEDCIGEIRLNGRLARGSLCAHAGLPRHLGFYGNVFTVDPLAGNVLTEDLWGLAHGTVS